MIRAAHSPVASLDDFTRIFILSGTASSESSPCYPLYCPYMSKEQIGPAGSRGSARGCRPRAPHGFASPGCAFHGAHMAVGSQWRLLFTKKTSPGKRQGLRAAAKFQDPHCTTLVQAHLWNDHWIWQALLPTLRQLRFQQMPVPKLQNSILVDPLPHKHI